jgi:hypothetical protein
MARETYQFTLTVDVFDARQLYEAAAKHEDAQPDPDDLLKDDEGEIDIGACLQMLLDPGSLAGCEIISGDAEFLSSDADEDNVCDDCGAEVDHIIGCPDAEICQACFDAGNH